MPTRISPWTPIPIIKIARENAELNGVGDRVQFFEGPITDQSPHFDFVCANLTLDVILPILSLLLERTVLVLVLSGILFEQQKQIVDAWAKLEVSTFEVTRSDEWIGIVVHK